MPVEFLTDEQASVYGRFVGPPSRADLERFFYLDDVDRELVAKRRGDQNRLGFGLQLVTVRFLGTFLVDPLDVPTEVLDFVAEQVEVADASAVKGYLERRSTRFEHQAEIAAAYGYREFAGVQQELARSIDHQAWLTGDGPKALFDAAVLWLRERRVLLPGVTTLARLVAQVRDAALQRLWETVAGLVTAEQARLLEDLLEGPRVSGCRSWSGCAAARRGSRARRWSQRWSASRSWLGSGWAMRI